MEIDGYNDFVFTAKTGNPYTHESIVRTTKLVVKRANEWEAERAKQENRKPVIISIHTPHVWRHVNVNIKMYKKWKIKMYIYPCYASAS